MKLDYSILANDLMNHRKFFLKRKNINRYKKQIKGTPIIIDKLINSFERKIKGISIFPDDIKKEYIKGLNIIFAKFYEETRMPKPSKRDAYINFLAENYILYGKGYKSIPFDEFVKRGLSNNYR